MKRTLILPLLTAVSLLGGYTFAAAYPPKPAVDGNFRFIADSQGTDSSAEHQEYIDKARKDIHVWRQRANEWADDAKAKAAQGGEDAHRALDSAWTDVKVKWQKLQAATPEAWDKTRAAFEEASQRMKDTWRKYHPQS